jgi:hypothetical protein
MLLSDRDIRAAVEAKRFVIEPYDPQMVQPSSIDIRLDRYFRVFENHRYPHIDPAQEQPDLTRMVEADGPEPFVLHPGEFVLASTYETVTLGDDVAARLEGRARSGLGCDPLDRRIHRPVHRTSRWSCRTSRPADQALAARDRPAALQRCRARWRSTVPQHGSRCRSAGRRRAGLPGRRPIDIWSLRLPGVRPPAS